MGDGSFRQAFERVYAWLESSDSAPGARFDLQRYDERFLGPDEPESILEIHVPVARRIEPSERRNEAAEAGDAPSRPRRERDPGYRSWATSGAVRGTHESALSLGLPPHAWHVIGRAYSPSLRRLAQPVERLLSAR
jgi:hypothetical protein